MTSDVYPALVIMAERASTAAKSRVYPSMVHGTAQPTVHSPDNGEARGDGEAIIDRTHLARMTMGEKHLEAEVLALFDRQAGALLARMQGAPPKGAAALAHTLAGSARGIGAWEVARAAQEVERAARGSSRAQAASAVQAVQALGHVVARAQAAIKELLGTS